MGNVLVIRKTDKTIHKAQLHQLAFLKSYNNKLPLSQRFTIEEMDEEEANKLPFIDKAYVSAGEAIGKVKTLNAQLQSKDDEIAALKALLAGQQTTGGTQAPVVNIPPAPQAPAPGAQADPSTNAAAGTANDPGTSTTSNSPAVPIGQKPANQAQAPQVIAYDRMSNKDLQDLLISEKIAFEPGAVKKDLIKLLRAADQAKK